MHNIFNIATPYVFRNEEKTLWLRADSLFLQVTTMSLRRNSVSTNSGTQVNQAERKLGLITASLRDYYNFTAQLSGRNTCDVTRLVATVHEQNKSSLL